MGMGDYTYANAFCAKQYAVEADFDGMLFSTADQNLVFNAYYSSLYDGWGGIGLSRMPDRNAAAPSSKQQFSVWADGGANGTETYAVFYDSNSPTEMYPEYLSESGYPTIDLVEPRIVAHLYIANSTWVYNYFTGADSDSFQVKITGSLGGVEKGSITLIGATTRAGSLSAPLRDRFGVTLRLELYTPEELATIVKRSAGILNVEIEPEGAMEIARRSRGTPRIANRMLRRVRDFAQVVADGVITRKVADEALLALEVDYLGLDQVDRRMLRAIIENYGGGPVGLETLAATIGEESVTLEDVYEPYLMQLGFLTRTPRGRCVTRKAYEHLHISSPEPVQLSL